MPQKHRFAIESTQQEEPPTSRLAISSLDVGWTSVLLTAYESEGRSEAFEKPPTPDQTLVVITRGQAEIECLSGGTWRSAIRRTGSFGMTPGGATDVMRWRAIDQPFWSLHLHIPQTFFESAIDEYRRAGSSFRSDPLDGLAMRDSVVAHVANALMNAASMGFPDLYAESATHFLVCHLLMPHITLSTVDDIDRYAGKIANVRLAAVIDLMRARYMHRLALAELAREAHVSEHHFGFLFKKAVGVTPHRFLVHLRLEAATAMLEKTDRTVVDIASACGFYSGAHFSESFRRHFRQTPSDYRRSRR